MQAGAFGTVYLKSEFGTFNAGSVYGPTGLVIEQTTLVVSNVAVMSLTTLSLRGAVLRMTASVSASGVCDTLSYGGNAIVTGGTRSVSCGSFVVNTDLSITAGTGVISLGSVSGDSAALNVTSTNSPLTTTGISGSLKITVSGGSLSTTAGGIQSQTLALNSARVSVANQALVVSQITTAYNPCAVILSGYVTLCLYRLLFMTG